MCSNSSWEPGRADSIICIFKCINQGPEKWRERPKVTQLVTGRAGFQWDSKNRSPGTLALLSPHASYCSPRISCPSVVSLQAHWAFGGRVLLSYFLRSPCYLPRAGPEGYPTMCQVLPQERTCPTPPWPALLVSSQASCEQLPKGEESRMGLWGSNPVPHRGI